jgi:uncharacterized protein (DUF2126 family)
MCCAICAITALICARNGTRPRPSSGSRSAARSSYEGVRLELRQALEPWHVLGETGAIGGTVRYTDSSVERLQVKLETADPSRYMVACNGRPVPLADAGKAGTVRGRGALQGLAAGSGAASGAAGRCAADLRYLRHLVGRPLGGCVYHVAHPGGRSYETFPVNGNEAEARRLARFEHRGHTPGATTPAPETPHPEFPFTLDLRRKPGI